MVRFTSCTHGPRLCMSLVCATLSAQQQGYQLWISVIHEERPLLFLFSGIWQRWTNWIHGNLKNGAAGMGMRGTTIECAILGTCAWSWQLPSTFFGILKKYQVLSHMKPHCLRIDYSTSILSALKLEFFDSKKTHNFLHWIYISIEGLHGSHLAGQCFSSAD